MTELLQDLIFRSAAAAPQQTALISGAERLSYDELAGQVRVFATALIRTGLEPGDRVGVFLEKRFETVVAKFGAAAAGGSFVPINPLFLARHVQHILRDCNVRTLVTSRARLRKLGDALADCPDLKLLVLVDEASKGRDDADAGSMAAVPVRYWAELVKEGEDAEFLPHRRIDEDMTSIFYTSGSTGMPKGVVLTHRNMVTGAHSVSQYLENSAKDRLLAALPFSFDAGFSQLTTGFAVGATIVLINYLLPRDVINAVSKHQVTGLTGVPPLFIQLAQDPWPEEATGSLRYIASTGGAMPKATLDRLRAYLPETKVYLMYGLTEAFRSTYLPPEELDRRPDSIGKAIPNAEILLAGPDGSLCGPGGEGELVHRGALVSKGYWNDPERTAKRFRPPPGQPAELALSEVAVWSGDIARMDEEGYLYFVGRRDDMIKTSGYRVSPTEVEEVLYASGAIAVAVALGAPHPTLGEAIVAVVTLRNGAALDADSLLRHCREQLPAYMVPHRVLERSELPMTGSGKIDRNSLREEILGLFQGE